MIITKKSLLYDIANLAYIIANMHKDLPEAVPYVRITDICEEGNRDRVARVLGLAWSHIAQLLAPISLPPPGPLRRDFSARVRDYRLTFRKRLSPQLKLKITETAREFMVCIVIADWLGMILPHSAAVWKSRMEKAGDLLSTLVGEASGFTGAFTRKIPPL